MPNVAEIEVKKRLPETENPRRSISSRSPDISRGTFRIISESLDPGQHLLLTPYIENGEIEKARSLSKVEKLPNAQHYIPSHSGFITVNKKHNSNMFYWFFPSLAATPTVLNLIFEWSGHDQLIVSSRHHIDDFMRGRIIGKIEEGRKITDVAREFDIAQSVVSRLWKSFKTTGMCSRRHGEGRVRSTTPAEDRYIVLSAKRNRRTTAQQVANQFLAASGKQISRKTVARRLRGGGLYARRPVVCVPLTRQHRTARLQWCREHHNWPEQDWACVLFSEESRFSLSSDCRRQLIWRESGTAYRPENIQEKDRYPTCSIMVLGRHHDQWPHAPTCGCEWDYDGQTIH
ncbi:transposable element Tcb1 transposase [Trichonephila clavipes]|nr:transposable element Tcb1 transposase [Trichonephila clavipes]